MDDADLKDQHTTLTRMVGQAFLDFFLGIVLLSFYTDVDFHI